MKQVAMKRWWIGRCLAFAVVATPCVAAEGAAGSMTDSMQVFAWWLAGILTLEIMVWVAAAFWEACRSAAGSPRKNHTLIGEAAMLPEAARTSERMPLFRPTPSVTEPAGRV